MTDAGADGARTPSVVRVWDGSVRLVHWALAALLPLAWWTAEQGDLARHRQIGLLLLGLVVYRVIWGVVGSETARFAAFLRGAGSVWAYLRSPGQAPIGHSPLGGWSVVAMLLALSAQIGLGLFATDEDGLESGPLSDRISFDASRAAAHYHHQLFWVLVTLVGLHVAAIVFYALVRRRNLVGPMITGRAVAAGPRPAFVSRWRMVVAAALAAAMAWLVATGLRG